MPPEALRAKPRYSDKLDTFSLGVVMVQIITRCFPTPTDAEIVVEDETTPTGEKILPVPELQRRQRDIGKVPPDHGLLPTALHCLKDRPRERPSAAQLCQSLGQLKTAEAYTASQAEDQGRRLEAEIARLQEQMKQLATEKDRLASQKQREIAELRSQLQTSHKPPVQQGREATTVSSPKDEKALYGAADRGDVSAVRRLLASNVNINCTPYPEHGWTPLMTASFGGHVEIVRLLVEAKAQLNIQGKEDGVTALHLAAQEGKADVVRLLTEAGAQLDIQKTDGATPLYMACQKGHSDVVEILIRNGANINLPRHEGATPVFIASQEGQSEVVNILLRNGAGVDRASNVSQSSVTA
ncbi:Ankyrin repeat domain-containing protein 29 [Geodia barretti]|uniref:Ankyrin repeat domain-containing protein 29 n=1 Tax=Geodia barretti TaxID=519541 RepID=A0AA35TEV1_GEOBA|nr:Ankyrin repeat domain-containing protein 29 [Geodia barretti]